MVRRTSDGDAQADASKRRLLNGARGRTVLFVLLGALVALALGGMVAAYVYYQDTLRTAQERNLTVVAQSAASNFSSYFDMQMAELAAVFSDEAVAYAFAACGGDAQAAVESLLKSIGDLDECVVSLTFEPAEAGEDAAEGDASRAGGGSVTDLDDRTCAVSWYREGDRYILTLAYPVWLAESVAGNAVPAEAAGLLGRVVETIDLTAVYAKVLAPIQVGERGYCTVKDINRVIVMHRLPGQIGVNTLTDRSEGHPEGDWSALNASQYSGEAGCEIVTSYWWDDPDAGLAKKFIAYAPAHVGGSLFSVNVVMAYDELMEPLRRMWVLCIALGACVLLVVGIGGWRLAKSMQDARHFERELVYEKELHAQTQRLKLQERQIQQIDRLQTMGVIASSLAHEMKNAMTPLAIYGQMLRDDDISVDERHEAAMEVEKLSQRCAGMLERMLSYVRRRSPSNAGCSFDASAAVRDALVTVRALCPRDVALVASVDERPFALHGETASIGQIVLNLVTNALYAMRDGGGTLAVSWGPDGCDGRSFALRVADTGCGMDQQTRQQLFGSFFTTKGDEGTGLGMSVVLSLVQSMHGSIEVHSELGQGSTFTLKFSPMDEADDKLYERP